ncbi:GTP-binding protein TrmE N-terminus-domain-containing protein [Kalaharituber pfeilii]|nr:GTP-binding protein TrmE N-terminus-domain-containing protein [Kalaharituber pfeilii]
METLADPGDTTIFALATPPGKSAIAVVRISGGACLDIYCSLCPGKPLPKPRHATLRAIYKLPSPPSATSDKPELLDPGALILYFPAPHSTTGEDILELHLHGGPAIIRSVLAAIPTCPSRFPIRYAEAGEFTRRAFLNDRLSLPQIEALGDTLSANTEQQRRLALRGGVGTGLTEQYENWRRQLVEARGELEALIDFSEDQSFETTPRQMLADVTKAVEGLQRKLMAFVENAVRGELLRDGISISLVGAPNVGKSSVVNRIVGREAVIVSGEAGTTRDVVDLSVDLGGYVMVVGDTAGLRVGDIGGEMEVVGEVEKEGIRRARKRVMEADVVVVVLEVEMREGKASIKIPREVVEVVREAREAEKPKEIVVAVNKIDLVKNGTRLPEEFVKMVREAFPFLESEKIVGISCRDEDQNKSIGIKPLLHTLTNLFEDMTKSVSDDTEVENSLAATSRQRILIEECLSYLDRYLAVVATGGGIGPVLEQDGLFDGEDMEAGDVDVVIAAEELRGAADCLARITGRGEGAGDVNEVLGVVFERFCVGK